MLNVLPPRSVRYWPFQLRYLRSEMKNIPWEGIPEMGECKLWDCVSSDDHNAVFDIFTEESKLLGERCRSGSATLKEKSTLTKFLVELGALQITVLEGKEERKGPKSVTVSIPDQRKSVSLQDSQPDESVNIVTQVSPGSDNEVTFELSGVYDEHQNSDDDDDYDAGDGIDAGGESDDDAGGESDDDVGGKVDDDAGGKIVDDVGGKVDDDGSKTHSDAEEVPIWMQDPPTNYECAKCEASFNTPWDFDFHSLECGQVDLHIPRRRPMHTKHRPIYRESEHTRIHCERCNRMVKRRNMLYHLFEAHDVPYDEAVQIIPDFQRRVEQRHASKPTHSVPYTCSTYNCSLCDRVVLKRRDILMHLYKLHDLPYDEAIQKYFVVPAKSSKLWKRKSTSLTNFWTKTKKQIPQMQRRRIRKRRYQTDSENDDLTTHCHIPLKRAFIKLHKIDNEHLERLLMKENLKGSAECNDLMSEIDSREKSSPTSATADVLVQDEQRSEITSEQDTDRVGPEDGHECEPNSELGKGVASTPDKQSGEIESQQTTLPTSDIADVKQDLDRSEILNEQDKDVEVGPKEDGHECEPNPEVVKGVSSTSHEQSGNPMQGASSTEDGLNSVVQDAVLPVTGDTGKRDIEAHVDEELVERNHMRFRDQVKTEDNVAKDGSIALLENSNKTPEDSKYSPERGRDSAGRIQGDGSFACSICGKFFNSETLVRDHKITVHFQCTACSRIYKNRYRLKLHLRNHQIEALGMTYTCSICAKVFHSELAYKRHTTYHSTQNLECEYCHMKLPNAWSLRSHINYKHVNARAFACNFCENAYPRKVLLDRHVNRKHIKEKKWNCDECEKGFYDKCDLTCHKNRVHVPSNRHLCELCGACFKHKKNLNQHLLTGHTKILPFGCEICGKRFQRSTQLVSHSEMHSDYLPFECKICGKRFRRLDNMKVHMDVHSDDRAYACKVCSKRFRTKATLYSHKVIHSTALPFACTSCPEKFRLKSQLELHKRVHTETYVYRHSCESCGKGFHLISQLRKHLLKVHNITPKRSSSKGKDEGSDSPIRGPPEYRLDFKVCLIPSTCTTGNQSHDSTKKERRRKRVKEGVVRSKEKTPATGQPGYGIDTRITVQDVPQSSAFIPPGNQPHDIVQASITESIGEGVVWSEAETPRGPPVEYVIESGISAQDERQSSSSLPSVDQSVGPERTVPEAEMEVECNTSDPNPAVITLRNAESEADVNSIVSEALVAILQSQGIQ